jgi:hypothetical protein
MLTTIIYGFENVVHRCFGNADKRPKVQITDDGRWVKSFDMLRVDIPEHYRSYAVAIGRDKKPPSVMVVTSMQYVRR